jgi:hypothetical protein
MWPARPWDRVPSSESRGEPWISVRPALASKLTGPRRLHGEAPRGMGVGFRCQSPLVLLRWLEAGSGPVPRLFSALSTGFVSTAVATAATARRDRSVGVDRRRSGIERRLGHGHRLGGGRNDLRGRSCRGGGVGGEGGIAHRRRDHAARAAGAGPDRRRERDPYSGRSASSPPARRGGQRRQENDLVHSKDPFPGVESLG